LQLQAREQELRGGITSAIAREIRVCRGPAMAVAEGRKEEEEGRKKKKGRR
jgi:hypothetical protein